jgi:two-component system chemotaxis response regulator CheB
MNMSKTRVIVVDDSALVRGLLAEIINRQPDMQCVGAASDPLVAREMIRNLNPDVITLDVEMPRMDGIDFLARLMRLRPMPVLMVSTLTERGADVTLKALELGAVDFVAKPKIGVADGLRQLGEDITDKIRTASKAQRAAPASAAAAGAGRHRCAGASCNGPAVDRKDHLHRRLHRRHRGHARAADEPAGRFSGGDDHPAHAARLHEELRRAAGRPVPHPRQGSDATASVCCPAMPTSRPAACTCRWNARAPTTSRVRDGEPVNRHKPSVEVLFDSAARVVGPNALGVMLTGMGGDGARAMKTMRDAGSWNLCQDEASCVVFGMPREAIAHGAAHEVLPLARIAPA